MKKQVLVLFIAGIMLAACIVRGEVLTGRKAAVFLNDGTKVIGTIADISRTRLVLELEDGTEINLSQIWMINFINTRWDFPQERAQIKTLQHHVFRRNGDIISGKIVDFSSRLKVFEFETGESIAVGAVKRIYFAKNVPGVFREQVKKKRIKKEGKEL